MSGSSKFSQYCLVLACAGILALFARAAFAQSQQSDTSSRATTLGPVTRIPRLPRDPGPSTLHFRAADGSMVELKYQRPNPMTRIGFRIPLSGWHTKGLDFVATNRNANINFNANLLGENADPEMSANERVKLRIGGSSLSELRELLRYRSVFDALQDGDVLNAVKTGQLISKTLRDEKVRGIKDAIEFKAKSIQKADSLCVECVNTVGGRPKPPVSLLEAQVLDSILIPLQSDSSAALPAKPAARDLKKPRTPPFRD